MAIPAARPRGTGRSLLKDWVFVEIRDAIIDGTLDPGEVLGNPQMESWLGVSRSPIRDALNRLTDIGLVVSTPNRYTRVAEIDPADLMDGANVLVALVGGLFSSRLAQARVLTVDSPSSLQTPIECISHFWTLTDALVTSAENSELERLVDRLRPKLEVGARRALETVDVPRYREQTNALTSAVRSGNVQEASDLYASTSSLAVGLAGHAELISR